MVVVKPVHPFKCFVFHCLEVAPRAAAVNDLRLEQAVDRLGHTDQKIQNRPIQRIKGKARTKRSRKLFCLGSIRIVNALRARATLIETTAKANLNVEPRRLLRSLPT